MVSWLVFMVSQEPATMCKKDWPCPHLCACSGVRPLHNKSQYLILSFSLNTFSKSTVLLKKHTKQITGHAERCHYTDVFKLETILVPFSRSLASHLPALTFLQKLFLSHSTSKCHAQGIKTIKSYMTSNDCFSLYPSTGCLFNRIPTAARGPTW